MIEAVLDSDARPRLARTALLLLPLQIVFRAGEALLPLFLASWFGRSDHTDIYYFAWAVFAFAGSLVFSAYPDSVLVPILAELRAKDPAALPKVLGSLLGHTLAYGGALAGTIGLGALLWFRRRYGAGEAFALSARMVPLFSLSLIAMGAKTFFFTLLASRHRYFIQPIASAMGIVLNLGLVYGMRTRLGVVAIPAGTLASEIMAASILAIVAIRGAKIRISLTLSRPPAVRRFARLVAAEVGGGAVTRINPIIDQFMAGLARINGGGTLLRYSGDVAGTLTSLLQATLLSPLVSHLAGDAAAGRFATFRRTVIRAILISSGVLSVVSLGLFFLRRPILRLAFLHGEMDPFGVETMAQILPYHLVGIPSFGALLVLARAHIALQNTRLFVPLGALNAVLNAGFNLPLVVLFGLRGIALSTSCVQAAIAIVFFLLLEKRLAEKIKS